MGNKSSPSMGNWRPLSELGGQGEPEPPSTSNGLALWRSSPQTRALLKHAPLTQR
jgi:hypothetical protein